MAEPRDLPVVKEALASIEEGGYAEAVARVGALLARRGAPLPLARLALKQELATKYHDLLPDVEPDAWRRIRGEQELIVRYEPERAAATLPILLRNPADRERLITLARTLLADERMQRDKPSTEQIAMLQHIGKTLHVEPIARTPRHGGREGGAQAGEEAFREAPTRSAFGEASARPRVARGPNGTQTREVPAPARLLQDAAANTRQR